MNQKFRFSFLSLMIASLLAFAPAFFASCETDADNSGGSKIEVPTDLKNTQWAHRDGDTVSFGTTTVTTKPVSGSEQTFTLKDTLSNDTLNQIILFFNDDQTKDQITYRNDTITLVNLGGINKSNNWSKTASSDPGSNNTGPTFTDIDSISAYLSTQTGGGTTGNPVYLSVNIQLTETNWQALFAAIDMADKYVNLDLSLCSRSSENTGAGLRSDGTLGNNGGSNGTSKVVALTVPDTATSIADYGFNYFYNLVSVSFPATTSVGNGAFSSCSNLISFILTGQGSLSTIEDGKALIQNNTILIAYPSASGEITLNNITGIGEWAFYGRNNLTSVSFPVATSIGEYAFYGCSNLSSVSFPVATSIGGGAFYECTSLTSVSFPVATSIGGGAFSGCSRLTSVSFPAATSIGGGAFSGCSRLTSVSFPAVTSIGISAFYGCSNLSSVSFPVATTIGGLAFYECTSLTSVSFPLFGSGSFFEGVISRGAFWGCTNLSSVTITRATTPPTLGESAFSGTSVNLVIYVPAGSVAAYQAASNWSTYASMIQAIL